MLKGYLQQTGAAIYSRAYRYGEWTSMLRTLQKKTLYTVVGQGGYKNLLVLGKGTLASDSIGGGVSSHLALVLL